MNSTGVAAARKFLRQRQRDARRRVAAHGHEARVAERELSGVAVDEIQADGEDDVDADINRDAEVVAVELRGKIRHDRRHENGREQKSFCARVHQTFSTVDLPSSPAGLNSRIKIKIANAMPSR